MRLESSVGNDGGGDDEILAEIYRVLSELAGNFESADDEGSILDWMSRNVFKRNKDGKKLEHLKNLLVFKFYKNFFTALLPYCS
jgi:hypothetical protein